ncbi:MAG: hypothetical protein JWM59_3275 [Verrucomicrobiales bacterium]|nr:hypothetical protein [Verrucomicrobiales bacterium]
MLLAFCFFLPGCAGTRRQAVTAPHSLSVEAQLVAAKPVLGRTEANGIAVDSTQSEVMAVMGLPDVRSRYDSLDEEEWRYGGSRVAFRHGRVTTWRNIDGSLRINYAGVRKPTVRSRAGKAPAVIMAAKRTAPTYLPTTLKDPDNRMFYPDNGLFPYTGSTWVEPRPGSGTDAVPHQQSGSTVKKRYGKG